MVHKIKFTPIDHVFVGHTNHVHITISPALRTVIISPELPVHNKVCTEFVTILLSIGNAIDGNTALQILFLKACAIFVFQSVLK